MATALEKIDKIENIHDEGTSTKLLEQSIKITVNTKESEPIMENGKLFGDWNDTKTCSHESANMNDSDFHYNLVCAIIDQQQLALIEYQLRRASVSFLRETSRSFSKPLIEDPVE